MSRSNQAAQHAIRDERLTRPLTVRPTIVPTPLRPIAEVLVQRRISVLPYPARQRVYVDGPICAVPCPEYHAALTYFRAFIEPLAP